MAPLIPMIAFAAQPLTDSQKQSLIERIEQEDRHAIYEAGRTADSSFIPVLEEYIRSRVNALSNKLAILERHDQEQHMPTGDFMKDELGYLSGRPDLRAARAALVKLGKSKYLDEIMSELQGKSLVGNRQLSGDDRYRAQSEALRNLAYINDVSTVRNIGPFLYNTADPYPPTPSGIDRMVAPSLAACAVAALREMAPNGPASNDIKAWQQWWEQNKDKYP
jgi:hypothetical protein